MAESKPVDEISRLHAYTMSFGNQIREILGKSLIECTKIDDYNDLSNNPQVQTIDGMVDTLITDFLAFDSTIDSLDEFHKTESQQYKEIAELSQHNKDLSQQLISKIKELDLIQNELGLVVDTALNTLDSIVPYS